MKMTCERCSATFEGDTFVGYCPDCAAHFRAEKEHVGRIQRPGKGICLDGAFADAATGPRSVTNPVTATAVCGLCGSDQLESGYGLGSGRGCGTYNFCFGCSTFLDFSPDAEDTE